MATRVDVDIAAKTYPESPGSKVQAVLRGLKFSLEPGVITALVGPSGCGKTTMLNIIAGLDRDYSGRVDRGAGADGGTPRLAYVFQNPRLLPWRTVYQNIEFVLPTGADPAVIDALLEAVDLTEFRDTFPNRLSLGMARRVAIARAFAVKPDLLLMDEAFTSLDEATVERMRDLLLDLWRAQPTTVLLVTHDMREAVLLASRIILLSPKPTTILNTLTLPDASGRDAAAVEAVLRDIRAYYR
jgi:NitT/TauT family transport system ATP-binding protein